MSSVNKVILIGNLTREPEVRYLTNGEAVANCSIACSEQWKGKDGTKQEKVEFINLVFYKKLAEIAGEYLKKGSQVYVEGKLQTRKWEKDGVTHYSTEVIVNNMTMLGGKTEQSEPRKEAAKPAKQAESNSFDDFDNSIPF